MLVSGLKRFWPVAALAAALVLTAACRGEDAGDIGDTPIPSTNATVAPGSDGELNPASEGASMLVPYYKSLPDLVRKRQTVVVGRVTGILLPCLHRPGYLGQPAPDYSDCALHPEQKKCLEPSPSPEELSRVPGRGFTVYSLEVQQVIASESLQPGNTIGFLQDGGICEDTPPEVAAAYDPKKAYEAADDPMVEIGSTYLFFLRPMLTGLKNLRIPEPWGTTYVGPAFGRFLIDADGRLQIVAAAWTCPECGASKALAGKTVAEAETTLRPIIERTKPTPTPTPQSATPSPTPTPTPTPTPPPGTPTATPQPGTSTPTPQSSTP